MAVPTPIPLLAQRPTLTTPGSTYSYSAPGSKADPHYPWQYLLLFCSWPKGRPSLPLAVPTPIPLLAQRPTLTTPGSTYSYPSLPQEVPSRAPGLIFCPGESFYRMPVKFDINEILVLCTGTSTLSQSLACFSLHPGTHLIKLLKISTQNT